MSGFRRVNKTLDLSPRIGPFPAAQLLPWMLIGLSGFLIGKKLLNFPLIWVLIFIIWGCSTWWVITAGGYYKFFAKFIHPPRWVRGMGQIEPLLSQLEQNKTKQ
ncbi:MAG: hypothetical protein WBM62_21670 [Crocosphaera sp.]